MSRSEGRRVRRASRHRGAAPGPGPHRGHSDHGPTGTPTRTAPCTVPSSTPSPAQPWPPRPTTRSTPASSRRSWSSTSSRPPSGDELYAEVAREVSTEREDIFTGTVRRARRATCWPGCGPGAPAGPARAEPDRAAPPTDSGCVPMAESVGTRSLTPGGRAPQSGTHAQRHVVIVAFDGLQPLDAVGPARGLRRGSRAAAGPRAVPAATGSPSPPPDGGTVRSESGLGLGTIPLPDPRSGSTPWSSPAATGPRRQRATRRSWPGSAGGTALPAGRHGVLRHLPRRRGRTAPTAGGSPPTGPVPASWPRNIPALPSTPIPIYIRDGKYWSSAGVTAGHRPRAGAGPGRSRCRRGPDRGPLAGDVPAPARRADAVRVAGVGPPCRALDRAGRADPRRVGPGRRPPAAGPGRGGRHERPPLHPGLHRRGRRDPEPLRRAHPARGGPARARDDERHARRRGGPLRARQLPKRCGASSNGTSASLPTPTAGASARSPSRTKGHPHDATSLQVAIPLFAEFTALDGVGPYEVLQRIPSIDVTFVGTPAARVRSENGMLGLIADATFEELPSPT